jgi:hypothetical protein
MIRSSSTALVRNRPMPCSVFGTADSLHTAGKDRTGVLAALLLSLAGADTSTIDRDYAYTRIGIEPARDFLTAKLMKGQQIDVRNPIMRKYAEIP